MKPDLKTMFPKASKSFLDSNPSYGGVVVLKPNQNATTVNLTPKRRSVMNKTEAEYAMILEAMKRKGEILRYEFEGMTLRFAGVKYTPDFLVYETSLKAFVNDKLCTFRRLKCIEVKGPFIKGNRERAVERFRHAKTYWPEFTFELHQRTKDGWKQLI